MELESSFCAVGEKNRASRRARTERIDGEQQVHPLP